MKKCIFLAVFFTSIGMAAFGRFAIKAKDSFEKIVVTGSSTIAPLMGEIGKRFEQQHPSVRVDIQTGGSSRGLADMEKGLANVGMVSRSAKPGEEGLQWFPIARDGICLIVHASHPLEALTEDQVVAIYRGAYTHWEDVGSGSGPITVINKAPGRSTLEVFEQHFGLSYEDMHAHVVIGDNQQGIKLVAGNPNAIGYVSIGSAASEIARGTPIKRISYQGVQATAGNVQNGSYPLTRTLHLVTREAPSVNIHQLIQYARSMEVHDLVQAEYFIPFTRR